MESFSGCDAILCPKGSFAPAGRQVAVNEPCQRCVSVLAKPFFGQTHCDEFSERNILLALFQQTNGGRWTRRNLWGSDQPVCAWDGVQCKGDSRNDHGVTSLRISENNLSGTLPTETLLLPSLVELNVSVNPLV